MVKYFDYYEGLDGPNQSLLQRCGVSILIKIADSHNHEVYNGNWTPTVSATGAFEDLRSDERAIIKSIVKERYEKARNDGKTIDSDGLEKNIVFLVNHIIRRRPARMQHDVEQQQLETQQQALRMQQQAKMQAEEAKQAQLHDEERRRREVLAQETSEVNNVVNDLTTISTSIGSMFTHISLVDPAFVANNQSKKTKYDSDIKIWQNAIYTTDINQLRITKSQLQAIKADVLTFEKEVKDKLEDLLKIKKAEITTLIQDVKTHFVSAHSLLDEIKRGDVNFEATQRSEVSSLEAAIHTNESALSVADLPNFLTIKGEVENSKAKMDTLNQDITDKLAQLKDSQLTEIKQLLQKIENASLSLQQKLDEMDPSDSAYVQSKQTIKDTILSIIPAIKNQYSTVNLETLIKFNSELTDAQTSLTRLEEEVTQKLNVLKNDKTTQIKALILSAKNNLLTIDEILNKIKALNFSQNGGQIFYTFSNTITSLIASFDTKIAQRMTIEATLAKEILLDTADLNQLIDISIEVKTAKDKTDWLKENAEVKLKASFILEAEYLRDREEFISAQNMLDLADNVLTKHDPNFAKKMDDVKLSIKEAMENKAVKKIESDLISNQDLQWLLAKMQKPSSLKANVKNKIGIDLDELNDLLAKNFDKVIKAENREIILFIGLTGSGKSTTINYLLGRSLKNEMAPNGETYIVPTQVDNSGNFPTIGTTAKAETLFPAVYQAPSEKFSYTDFPGFMDNRGEAAKVCTHIFSQIAINAATHIKEIVVVIECDSLYTQRAAGLRNLAMILGELLKDPKQMSQSIRFVITKPNGKKLEHVKYQISSLCTILKTDPTAEKELAIVELMNQTSQNLNDHRITFIDPVDNGQSRDPLITQFKSTSGGIRKEDFNSVPADTHSKLHEILTLVNKQKNKMQRIVDLSAIVNQYKAEIVALEPQITVSNTAKNLLVNLKDHVISMENFIGQTQQEFTDSQDMLQIFEKITTLMGFSSAISAATQAPLPNFAPQLGQPLGNIAPVVNTQITQPQQMQQLPPIGQPPPPYSSLQQGGIPQNGP
jgi:energy-coupling factor transporter ATP-binding protein EcfA2